MRAGNTTLERYRLDTKTILAAANAAGELGFRRIFLIAGEDPKFGFDNLLSVVEGCKKQDFFVSLACGEYEKSQYFALRAAGADEYVLKFEMAQEALFNRMKPSTTFKARMQAAEWIKQSGMLLASGNIVDYPGQTDEHIAEDIMLMKALDISWAPVIPYLPAKGTPLAAEGGRGSLEKNLKEISILRIMMPKIRITAQQPGENMANGLADPEGNQNALAAGADMLFADMLPAALVKNFSVIDNRVKLGYEHIKTMAERAGMKLRF
jgi:biotin synthase